MQKDLQKALNSIQEKTKLWAQGKAWELSLYDSELIRIAKQRGEYTKITEITCSICGITERRHQHAKYCLYCARKKGNENARNYKKSLSPAC